MSTEAVLQNSGRYVGGVPQKPPVQGGSGRQYWTIRDALAGEAALATTVSAVVPQAGTQAGTVVFQAGQSAVDEFYKDQWVLNTDTTPTNGLVSQFTRISKYVGASRTATLDKPWDFSGESSVSIIKPAQIWLAGDVEEDVTITIPVVINLQGHRIRGKIDVTGGNFLWIRGGNGYVTNGIQKTDYGLLKLDGVNVSRRDDTIYAVLLTSGSDLGRCELIGCQFEGRVAGRRGYSGWNIRSCTNLGAGTTTLDLAYTLVESISGVAITLTALDVSIDSELAGAIMYSENNLTGGAAYISIQGDIRTTADYLTPTATAWSPKRLALAYATGSATLSATQSTGLIGINVIGFVTQGTQISNSNMLAFTCLSVKDFSGTALLSLAQTLNASFCAMSQIRLVSDEGTVSNTGSVTFGGNGNKNFSLNGSTSRIIANRVENAGTITVSGTGTIAFMGAGRATFSVFDSSVSFVAGTSTITISAPVRCLSLQWIGLGTPTGAFGTFTFSGSINITYCELNNAEFMQVNLTSGTVTVSGTLEAHFGSTSAQAPSSLTLMQHAGTGGTFAVSGSSVTVFGGRYSTLIIVRTSGAGGTSNMSATAVTIGQMSFTSAITGLICRVDTTTSTATLTGTLAFYNCRFESSVILTSLGGAGSAITGPSALSFDYCDFLSSLQQETGTGTLTWTGATFNFRQCYMEGLWTPVLTRFTTVEAFHTRFNGGSSNKSISASGTRPTTFRYWACSFAQRFDDVQPEVMNVYDVLPAQAALVQGQPVFINNNNQYKVCVAASIVDAVLVGAAGGAGTFAVGVRDGRVFIAVNAAVAKGDNLALDLATPTQATVSAFTPGQNVGTALEAAGATVANKAYAAVNVR